jgi:hypothetical protein
MTSFVKQMSAKVDHFEVKYCRSDMVPIYPFEELSFIGFVEILQAIFCNKKIQVKASKSERNTCKILRRLFFIHMWKRKEKNACDEIFSKFLSMWCSLTVHANPIQFILIIA